jgi:hypothetical protein
VGDDVTSFEALDEYYVMPVRVRTRHLGSLIQATVTDPEGRLPLLGGGKLRLDRRRFGLRQSDVTRAIEREGTYYIAVSEPAAETTLEADGVLLDVSGGYFIDVTQSVPPISGGVLPDFDNLKRVTTAWRTPAADPDVDGRAIVRRLVSRHGARMPDVVCDLNASADDLPVLVS